MHFCQQEAILLLALLEQLPIAMTYIRLLLNTKYGTVSDHCHVTSRI